MAAPSNTVWGSISSDKGKLGIAISENSTNTKITLTVQVWLALKYNINDNTNSYYFTYTNDSGTSVTNPNGTSLDLDFGTTSGSGWAEVSQKQIASYSFTYTRGTSNKTVNFSAELNNLGGDNYDVSVSTSYTIPRKNKLSLRYHVNGGSLDSSVYYVSNGLIYNESGSDVIQSWYYNTGSTSGLINDTTFGLYRKGYNFLGWKVGSSGTTIFDQDDVTIVPTDLTSAISSADATVTLYAVWELAANCYVKQNGSYVPAMMYLKSDGTYKNVSLSVKVSNAYKETNMG